MNTRTVGRTAEFEAQLRARRSALIANVRERLHCGEDPGSLSLRNYLEAMGEQAEADVLADSDIAMVTHELTELKDIDAALGRIRDGSYGICAECGSDIDPARLRVQPTAQLCVPCRTLYEKRHGIARHAEI